MWRIERDSLVARVRACFNDSLGMRVVWKPRRGWSSTEVGSGGRSRTGGISVSREGDGGAGRRRDVVGEQEMMVLRGLVWDVASTAGRTRREDISSSSLENRKTCETEDEKRKTSSPSLLPLPRPPSPSAFVHLIPTPTPAPARPIAPLLVLHFVVKRRIVVESSGVVEEGGIHS